MEKIGNVELYIHDEEIIDILTRLPKIDECANMKILEFIEKKTNNADFGTVVGFCDYLYTLYKFDKDLVKSPSDAGLILTKSGKNSALEQLSIWKEFKKGGMSFSNTIFDRISETLTAHHSVNKFYGNGE